MSKLLRHKLQRDIGANPGQFCLMAIAVFLSVFALMALIGGLVSIQRVTTTTYLATHPAHATIETDGVKELPSTLNLVGTQSERRGSILGRIADNQGKWFPLLIFVVDDFAQMRIGQAFPDRGIWPPPAGNLSIERTGLELISQKIGTAVKIILPGTATNSLIVAGTAHDPGLAPAWQERTVYGYISLATARALFGPSWQLAELKLIFDTDNIGAADIRRRADSAADILNSLGFRIEEIQVPPPRLHPHQSQMNTILAIFLVFAGLSLVLSGILLAIMVRSLLIRETRSIGIMKTLGATPGRLVRHYLSLSLVPAVVGTAAAVPLGFWAASGLAELIISLLNIGSGQQTIPLGTCLIPIASGILIPLAFTLVPVVTAIRQNVRTALSGHLPAQPKTSVARLRLPRSLALALRNLGRRPATVALTVGLLACSALIFLMALNIASGWQATVALGATSKKYDLEIRLATPTNTADSLSLLAAIPGVRVVESWPRASAYPQSTYHHTITTQYPDRGHGSFTMRAWSPGSSLFFPQIVQGSWPPRTAQTDLPIMLNQNALALFPGSRIGSPIALFVNGKQQTFRLQAVAQEIAPATAWVSPRDFPTLPATGPNLSNSFYLAFDQRALPSDSQKQNLIQRIETAIVQLGGSVEMSLPQAEFAAAIVGHVWILIIALILMGTVIGLVGLIGLAATMSASVLDRTREIGVMRAIGSSPFQVLQLILGEAVLQAIVGLLIAAILCWPATLVLGNIIGMMSFRIPLVFSLNLIGVIIAVLALPLGSLLAASASARQASRINLRQALAYE